MAAPKGNQFWRSRSTHGRKPIFSSPEELWNACAEYFDWCYNNPLEEEKVFQYQGEIVRTEVSKMRAMTIQGMCVFLDISFQGWKEYKGKDDFSEVCTRAEEIIYDQKFTGAAADLLNPSIIARDLGLADRMTSDLTVVWHEEHTLNPDE